MNKEVVIIGAGGHGKVIADIVRESGDIVFGFLDDDINKETLGGASDWVKYKDCYFIVGIGDSKAREKISKMLIGVRWYTAIHPTAIISKNAIIGEGCSVMPNAVINNDAYIGKHCIINTSAVVEHNNAIDDFAHVAVGAKLGGNVKIGKHTWVGIGSIVSNNITVCDNCILGAGTIVVKDIIASGKYMGSPAKIIN